MAYNDTPDWGGYYINQSTYPLMDLAEHAARVGSVMSYDRRGSYLWHTTFEHGLGSVTQLLSGAGAAVALDASSFESGPFSAKLTPGTTLSQYAGISRIMSFVNTTRVGFSTAIRIANTGLNVRLGFDCGYGSLGVTAMIKLDFQALKMYVQLPAPTWQEFGDALPNFSSQPIYFFCKVVGDATTGKFVRFTLGPKQYDISAYTSWTTGPALYPFIRCQVLVYRGAAGTQDIYVDRLVLTSNEPES